MPLLRSRKTTRPPAGEGLRGDVFPGPTANIELPNAGSAGSSIGSAWTSRNIPPRTKEPDPLRDRAPKGMPGEQPGVFMPTHLVGRPPLLVQGFGNPQQGWGSAVKALSGCLPILGSPGPTMVSPARKGQTFVCLLPAFLSARRRRSFHQRQSPVPVRMSLPKAPASTRSFPGREATSPVCRSWITLLKAWSLLGPRW